MSIATLAEVKAILGIDDTSLDTRIQALIPTVQADIIAYCKDNFNLSKINYTSTSFTFEATGKKILDSLSAFITEKFQGFTDIVITYSLLNNKNFTVSTVAAGEIVVTEVIINEDNADLDNITIRPVVYPDGLDSTFANMIWTKISLDGTAKRFLKSKKLETFSVTYNTEDYEGGYLKSDLQALNKYRQTYRRT